MSAATFVEPSNVDANTETQPWGGALHLLHSGHVHIMFLLRKVQSDVVK